MHRLVRAIGLAGLLGCRASRMAAGRSSAGAPRTWMPEAPGYSWVFADSPGVRDTLVSLGAQDFCGASSIVLERTAGSRYPGRRTCCSNLGTG